jgi:hypothetical protein
MLPAQAIRYAMWGEVCRLTSRADGRRNVRRERRWLNVVSCQEPPTGRNSSSSLPAKLSGSVSVMAYANKLSAHVQPTSSVSKMLSSGRGNAKLSAIGNPGTGGQRRLLSGKPLFSSGKGGVVNYYFRSLDVGFRSRGTRRPPTRCRSADRKLQIRAGPWALRSLSGSRRLSKSATSSATWLLKWGQFPGTWSPTRASSSPVTAFEIGVAVTTSGSGLARSASAAGPDTRVCPPSRDRASRSGLCRPHRMSASNACRYVTACVPRFC